MYCVRAVGYFKVPNDVVENFFTPSERSLLERPFNKIALYSLVYKNHGHFFPLKYSTLNDLYTYMYVWCVGPKTIRVMYATLEKWTRNSNENNGKNKKNEHKIDITKVHTSIRVRWRRRRR